MASSIIQHDKEATLDLVHISLQGNDNEVLKELKFHKSTSLRLLRMYVTQVLLWSGYLYFKETLINLKSKHSLESLRFKSDTDVFKLRRYKIIQGQIQDLKLHIKGEMCTLHNVPSSFTVDLLKFMIECEYEIPMQSQVLKFRGTKWIHDSHPSYICARRELIEDMTVEVNTPSPTLEMRSKVNASSHLTNSVEDSMPSPKVDVHDIKSKVKNSYEVSTSSPKTDLKNGIKPFIAPCGADHEGMCGGSELDLVN